MSKRPATSTTTTRGRGRGRGGGRGASMSATKKPKKTPERECLLLLIDSSSNSLLTESNEKSSFENSINITDWILSRKIFAESDSFVGVAHFPTSDGDYVYENVKFYSDMFIKPVIDQLKWLYDIQQSRQNGDIFAALKGSLEFIKQARSESYVDKITIALLSNLSGEVENISKHELKELCDELNENNINLLFIGDTATGKSDTPTSTLEALGYIKEHCETQSQLFENALNKVSFFAQKPKAPRAQPFSLELSKELKIDLQLLVKISDEKIKIKFQQVTDDHEMVSRIREYEEVKDDEVKTEVDEDALEGTADGESKVDEHKNQTFTRGELIKGYHYGSSIIPFSEGDKQMAAIEKPGKCLQLIQFTKKFNILPHFLLSECRYFLPGKSDTAATALSALVQAMMNLEVVAIARYAYNIISNPKTCVLIPKISKTGCPILQHFILPFNEDIRGFEFPEMESLGEEPNDFQLDAIEAYIDEFMLVDKVKDESGKIQKIEQCRIKDIRNPGNQSILMSVKRKALGMPAELSEDETKALFEMMSAPAEKLKKSKKVMEILAKSFELKDAEPKKVELKKVESAEINGKSWNENNGSRKVEKEEDMDIE
uniref:Ku domain-containing protein n=1 Tax=Panagrolaimus superbus TaxID=310955 RepID=A0A914YU12_9BILA